MRTDLRSRIQYALNEDHGHSNRSGSIDCRTCARRTELIAVVVEDWMAER